MSDFMLKILNHESPTFYEGYERDGRDFIYVDDINDFHLMCIEDDRVNGKLFRLGTGKTSTIKEVWETLNKIAGSDVKPIVTPGPVGHIPVMTRADASAAQALGWKAKTSLEDGLRAQFEYLKSELSKANNR